jgi:hypothetical protein
MHPVPLTCIFCNTRMFLGLPDPDLLLFCTEPDPDPCLNKLKKVRKTLIFFLYQHVVVVNKFKQCFFLLDNFLGLLERHLCYRCFQPSIQRKHSSLKLKTLDIFFYLFSFFCFLFFFFSFFLFFSFSWRGLSLLSGTDPNHIRNIDHAYINPAIEFPRYYSLGTMSNADVLL